MKTLLIVVAIFVLAVGIFGAPSARAVSMTLPTAGGSAAPTTQTPATFINSFYQFALLLSGILAFGAIIFGGVKYITSAGNPSAQSEGKEWIYSALLGLALLASAYLILNTINPALVQLSLPGLSQVQTQTQSGNPFNSGPGNAPAGGSFGSY
jgi:hypothetical protein